MVIQGKALLQVIPLKFRFYSSFATSACRTSDSILMRNTIRSDVPIHRLYISWLQEGGTRQERNKKKGAKSSCFWSTAHSPNSVPALPIFTLMLSEGLPGTSDALMCTCLMQPHTSYWGKLNKAVSQKSPGAAAELPFTQMKKLQDPVLPPPPFLSHLCRASLQWMFTEQSLGINKTLGVASHPAFLHHVTALVRGLKVTNINITPGGF